jgi:hypothetical protein
LTVDSQTVATKEVTLGRITNKDPVVLGTYRGSGPGPAGHFLGTLDEAVIEMR